MAGLKDLKQPALHWLSDCFGQFSTQLEEGKDPSVRIDMEVLGMPTQIEIRLMKAGDVFERRVVERKTTTVPITKH